MWPFQSSRSNTTTTTNHAEEALSSARLLEEPLGEQMSEAPENVSGAFAHIEDVEPRGLTSYPNERLKMHPATRAILIAMASFGSGFTLGWAQASPKAGYRYRAENAHRLPTTEVGWYLYQKSKGYHQTVGGFKEGVKFGSICTGWALLFMATEEAIDLSRARIFARGDDDVATGQRDVASTVVAAMSMSGIYSWRKRLDHWAAGRTAKAALKFSIAFGLTQDLLATIRGNPPAYIQWLKRTTWPGPDSSKIG
jgi:hypothetical protein